ncbi:MAG: hypothetical protein ABSA47_16160 [Verrucomicrobiota bacterium]|jgi:hypothetical protein
MALGNPNPQIRTQAPVPDIQAASGAAARPFVFEQDTFAFPNELVWAYQFDPATGKTTSCRRDPPPTYALHCFVLVRSVRQFFWHARFEPAAPALEDAAYHPLVRQVMARNPRRPCAVERRIVFPGYSCLRQFSQEREKVLKGACGGAWQSYFLRSHWRMILPVFRWQEAWVAPRLARAVRQGRVPIVHLVRFPQLTINHGIVLYAAAKTEPGLQFTAYDPNIPERPSFLQYDAAKRTFFFAANCYWAGGRVDVFQIYHNCLY